ncbi:hypothetical protein BDP27DRAFT_1364098 [Rhodocollybia butyracea]|uniref:BTB domain-containing protein n=1 Tax=Rhodocollybia butyracea TaxID=206335 RepID=A0A9P5PS22_9AGAR|nr:hypothetical protein BDP27DRAFT_1364098 [Rhodocollybia butyracea]
MSNSEFDRISEDFTTGNVSFRSSDHILFRLDRMHLEFASNAFPSATSDEVIELSEESDILEILFTFVYPRLPIPDIDLLSFDTLVRLIEAAYKYALNAALEIALLHLQKHASEHRLEVLRIAGAHNCGALLAAVAPYYANKTTQYIEDLGFSAKHCVKWVRFCFLTLGFQELILEHRYGIRGSSEKNGYLLFLAATISLMVTMTASVGKIVFIHISGDNWLAGTVHFFARRKVMKVYDRSIRKQ